jgi:general stress protein 26
MMKIINAFQGMGDPMTEEETINYMPSSDNSLLIPLGLIDEKGEPNIVPIVYYFDDISNKIYLNTLKTIKKVRNLRKKNH